MGEPTWSWTLHRHIESSLDQGHVAIEQLLSALHDHNWEGRDFFHVQMAAEEAMVNAVKHGNQEASDKQVELEFKVSEKSTYMRFKDEGPGFDPSSLPDPRDEEHLHCTNGRGVMLIFEMMDEVNYLGRGNEVEMLKHRSPDDQEPSS